MSLQLEANVSKEIELRAVITKDPRVIANITKEIELKAAISKEIELLANIDVE